LAVFSLKVQTGRPVHLPFTILPSQQLIETSVVYFERDAGHASKLGNSGFANFSFYYHYDKDELSKVEPLQLIIQK
jgi:hypothetical protein